ncbi:MULTISPECIES: hypothetical protein [Chryseobacterium]|uniref:Lipoprotein n=1 Tax=Chryseobacterium rhizosphaerae TaxID=395937 RepID=A0ABX9IDT0_9FLAO|nr:MULTISPECIES: hypothetical protein [Chryseobacterium]MDR6546371.1 hypothetical protein [Chryseobacterium rhizosphaerae]REC70079.1 hypothetical protein DRF57_22520 [Chryseobacterium rhizosphaerae]GEN69703.1 hypothetical protein CRH01_42710 [Chryseobacterium rhizosphaerae]SMC41671.1 hypothetical protein SAMN02787074_1133 [Chryseobacterium sp. YR221]
MKKIILTAALFCFTFFYSQKNQNYLQIGYASVCCGPPSEKPVISYLKEFKKKNQIKSLEILIQNGMGREGEFNVYVGTDYLSVNQKSRLIRGLMATVSNQNNRREQKDNGLVNFNSEITVKQQDINTKNLTIYKK